MHDIVAEQFDDHRNGRASQALYEHLAVCPDCVAELAELEQVTNALHEFRPDTDSIPAPSLGFYNRVACRIREDEQSQSWSFFSPGIAFFRRVAFASLLLLAGLGSYLVTREAAEPEADAVSIMAQHDVLQSHPESSDRDNLLFALANYRE